MLPTVRSNCVFCDRSAGRPAAQWDTVLAETSDYIIVPTKGALVPGWLLVVSKRHFLCAGALPPEEFENLEEAINLAVEMVAARFGPVTIFEHGPRVPGTAVGCGIDHLHIHAVPLKLSLTAAVGALFPDTEWQRLSRLSDLRQIHARDLAYGVVKEHGADLAWCPAPSNVRQFFRRVIAHSIGTPEEFDYSAHSQLHNVIRTLDRLRIAP